MSQVITIGPDGSMSGLQVKPGRGVDLRQFGRASIVRASEIVWDETHQAWTVVIQDAPGMDVLKGVTVTLGMASLACVLDKVAEIQNRGLNRVMAWGQDNPLRFSEYDEAVEFEIAYLDAWRLKGRF